MIWHEGRARRTLRLLVDVHYMPDGTMRWQISEPDKGKRAGGNRRKQKWRLSAASGGVAIPSREDLRCKSVLPGPVDALMRAMQYDIHCLEIDAAKRAKRWEKKEEKE